MVMHTSMSNIDTSIARECQEHLSDPTSAHGLIDHVEERKWAGKRKQTDHEYHVQDRKYVQHKSVKMSCAPTQFQALSFCGPHTISHLVRGLSKHYHLQLGPKLGHGKCAIRQTPYTRISCTNMLDKIWVIGSDPTSQPHYQPVEDCTYWHVLGSFKTGTLYNLPIKKQQTRTLMQCIKLY